MGVRAYVLLNIADGKSEHAVIILRSKAGVVSADPLEGRPDVIVTVEAPDRQRLAESVIPVITCVEGITEDLQLLVLRENGLPSNLSDPKRAKPPKWKKRKRKNQLTQERHTDHPV